MMRRTKERLRVMMPASILALMLGLLFAPAVGAYWNAGGGAIPSYFDVANGNYPKGIYTYASTPDPDMSCGPSWQGNAMGMGLYSQFVQAGVAKLAWGPRSAYSIFEQFDGDILFTADASNLVPASYHIYQISYLGVDSRGLRKFNPTVYYDGSGHNFPIAYLSEMPHSSYTGIESDVAGCLTGYSQFQSNLYQPSIGAAMQPWCYADYGQPTFATKSLPFGPCVDGNGKQWWIGS